MDDPIYNIDAHVGSVIHIGRQFETGIVRVHFKYQDLLGENYEVTNTNGFQLFIIQGEEFYLQDLGYESDGIYWDITNINTSYLGLGKCELIYADGTWDSNNVFTPSTILKSFIYDIVVTETLFDINSHEQPAPIEAWVNKATALYNQVKNANEFAEKAEYWAKGTIQDIPVTQNHEAYQNNAKYYKEQSEINEANAHIYKNTAQAYSDGIKNLTVSSTTSGSEFSVTKTLNGGLVNLEFNFPEQIDVTSNEVAINFYDWTTQS